MDVLFLAKADYSNVGYLFAKALQSVGMTSEAWAVRPSPRVYYQHAFLFRDLDKLESIIREAKATTLMHSNWYDEAKQWGNLLYVFHGGSVYRQFHEKLNPTFNANVEKSIIQTGDLFNLGAKNEVWILPCTDIELLHGIAQRKDWHNSRYVIAHFPHKSYIKGTESIHNVLVKLRAEDLDLECGNPKTVKGSKWTFRINDQILPWHENLVRMAECDIYIEACNPTLAGAPYGEWGLSAIEAASMSKIVVTHFLSYKRYLREYGKCPLQVANNEVELEAVLRKLLAMTRAELNDLKREHYKWVKKFHSFKAVGTRLKEKVYDKI